MLSKIKERPIIRKIFISIKLFKDTLVKEENYFLSGNDVNCRNAALYCARYNWIGNWIGKLFTYKIFIAFIDDRVEYDRNYTIDTIKLKTELNWKTDQNFETDMLKVIDWHWKKYA